VAIKCPSCHADNPETVKFCGTCATRLTQVGPLADSLTKTLETPVHALTKGTLVAGKYRIDEEIGRGGMGIVYRAEDTRLDRPVAVKVLPHDKVIDPERKRRFIQEAKAASALNHPHIITIYDIGQAEGLDFIAMEYVDGRTLEDLIGRKGLKLNEALKYSVQVADALAVAHEAGIVHRDLKPGNVMLTTKGQVKVLDFGLAKLTEILPPAEADPTRTFRPATEEGKIVGTVAYMSPEQAEGKKVDARSDIFSFGSLLYEMVTGSRAFQGESSASTMASILKDNPKPAGQMVKGLPREVERLISRCLRKEVDKRFQHMDDVKIALEELKEESDSGTLTGAVPVSARPRSLAKFLALPVLVIGLAAMIWLWSGRSRRVTPEPPSAPVPLISSPGDVSSPTFSPDGNEIAFVWNGRKQDNYDIYRKLIGGGEPLRLTSDPAVDYWPAWSPDGRFIAFVRTQESGNALYLIPALGGPERRLAEKVGKGTPAWSPDSKWLVTVDGTVPSGQPAGLQLVSVETGEKRRLTSPPKDSDGDRRPSFSPEGRALVFLRGLSSNAAQIYRLRLTKGVQPAGEPERLTNDTGDFRCPVWTGDGKGILYIAGMWHGGAFVTRRLLLTEKKSSAGYPSVLEPMGVEAHDLALSPRGHRLAYTRFYQDINIYRLELPDRSNRVGKPEKFISSTRTDFYPMYSPDGKTIVFASDRSGSFEIWLCDADGSSLRQLTSEGGRWVGRFCWSPDGEMIAFASFKDGSWDICLISPHGGPSRRLTFEAGAQSCPSWSHDGKWIYFTHWGIGVGTEVSKIPSGGGRSIQVTKNGGEDPRESPDGKWLYFTKKADLWRMPVSGGEVEKIYPGPWYWDMNSSYAVVDDGIYFIKERDSLDFLDFSTRKTQTIARIDDRLGPYGITVSPDRRWILFGLLDTSISEILLVENFR
jgi:serine/threonine protein kinase